MPAAIVLLEDGRWLTISVPQESPLPWTPPRLVQTEEGQYLRCSLPRFVPVEVSDPDSAAKLRDLTQAEV